MLLDMNSYFASVEQQANPFLRGRPVGVVASLVPTSCIIAASKEAKKLGVKTGTLVYQAQKLIPNIVLIKQDPDKYRQVNRRIGKIIGQYSDCVENYSIDEWFIQMSDLGFRIKDKMQNPLLIAIEIKQRIRKEVGEWLTCSVGIAPNKFMAKLASDMNKPDGLTVVWRENLPEIYKHKKLSDLWGIARGWEDRLSGLGIVSPQQLLGYSVQNLISVFGKPGFYIWQRVNGLEEDVITGYGSAARNGKRYTSDEPNHSAESRYEQRRPLTPDDHPQSFGHSWVLNFRTTDKSRLGTVVLRLAEKAARRMRRSGYMAHGIYIRIRLVNGVSFSRVKKLKYTVSTGLELYQQVLTIWNPWEFKADIMHIAVGFHSLVDRVDQLELPYRSDRPAKSLIVWLDAINNKYGEFTIQSALITKTKSYAPDAIAFGK
jgi:DNA polymerase IV